MATPTPLLLASASRRGVLPAPGPEDPRFIGLPENAPLHVVVLRVPRAGRQRWCAAQRRGHGTWTLAAHGDRFDEAARRHLRGVVAPAATVEIPDPELASWLGLPHQDYPGESFDWIHDLLSREGVPGPEAELAQSPRRVVLHTDASRRSGARREVGLGWVVEYEGAAEREPGVHGIFQANFRGGIDAAELAAMATALRKVAASKGVFRRLLPALEIVSDSRNAVSLARRLLRNPREAAEHPYGVDFRDAVAAFPLAEVSLRWVRGHNGNVRNEYADRAAVLVRRHGQQGFRHSVTKAALRGLRAQLQEELLRGTAAAAA